MITVNLTEEQLALMEELVGEKFNQVAQAWLPAEETKEMNNLCYNTMLNLRCVRMAKQYDEDYVNRDKDFFSFDKKEYLKDVGFIQDSQLEQQGICS